jgi:hypothetical protein
VPRTLKEVEPKKEQRWWRFPKPCVGGSIPAAGTSGSGAVAVCSTRSQVLALEGARR